MTPEVRQVKGKHHLLCCCQLLFSPCLLFFCHWQNQLDTQIDISQRNAIYFLKNIILKIITLSASLALVESLAKCLGNFSLLVHNILNFVEAINKLGNSRNKALKYP